MHIPIVTVSSGACYLLHSALWGVETRASFLDMFDFMRGSNTIGEIVPETSTVPKKLQLVLPLLEVAKQYNDL
jgi:hypothetical protein